MNEACFLRVLFDVFVIPEGKNAKTMQTLLHKEDI